MTDIRLPKENGVTAMLIASILIVAFSMISMYWLLMQMELQKTLTLPNKLEFEEGDDETSTTSSSTNKDGDGEPEKKADEVVSGRMVVTTGRKVLMMGIIALIVLLSYTMLVLSEANSFFLWLPMSAILIILLYSHIQDEVRRQRLDRLSAILSFVLLLTMALQLAVYAYRGVTEGQVHEGKARIIGYDMDQYDQGQGKDTVTRTDLTVAWGGSWGCPNHPDTYCEATLHGTLCETEEENRRRLADDADAAEQENEELEEEVEEMEEENEELEEENEELEEDVEYEEEVIEEYADYDEELEEELEYTYYYDDDIYEDMYWDEQDWESIWGEYACADLFSADLAEQEAYDPDQPAGEDDWPFVNIYGDCKTCHADIVNFYSTQYYQSVQDYKKAARNYGLAAGLSFVITLLLVAKQRFNPTADKEIELLSRHGPRGALA